MLSNILSEENISPYQRFHGKMSNIGRGMKTFVQLCIKQNVKNHQDKLKNRGEVAIIVGYPDDHHFDTYRLFMKETQTIAESRDVVWMNKSFHKYLNTKKAFNKSVI
jgi:hypothetical protein